MIVTLVPATKAGVAVPVPPLATASVPPRVTTPVVAVAGVRPVEPPLNESTPVVARTVYLMLPELLTTCQALPCV